MEKRERFSRCALLAGHHGEQCSRTPSCRVNQSPVPSRPGCVSGAWDIYSESGIDFRKRLLATLRAIDPVLREPGILVVGSEVPNLLEPDARSSLVVSVDSESADIPRRVDIAVPVERHAAVKAKLREIRSLERSREEPSVWLPLDRDLIEVNFLGMDAHGQRAGETYVFEDDTLPLLVFGQLSLLRAGKTVRIDDLSIPLPRPAGLIVEKLLTDRSGEKGDRDLLVALALLLIADAGDLSELESIYKGLAPDLRYAMRSGLGMLSLLEPRPQMPDPTPHRALIRAWEYRQRAYSKGVWFRLRRALVGAAEA
jgi:hypothetical protein